MRSRGVTAWRRLVQVRVRRRGVSCRRQPGASTERPRNKCHGWPEEAIRSFERAIRMSPVDLRLYLTLGGMAQAFIELGRFDEAIVAAKKAQRLNPAFQVPYRCLASAFAHLGRDAEAREAAAHLLEIDPGSTISAWIARGGQSNSKLAIEGLRKAGLPE